jgi:hypothetical protein
MACLVTKSRGEVVVKNRSLQEAGGLAGIYIQFHRGTGV